MNGILIIVGLIVAAVHGKNLESDDQLVCEMNESGDEQEFQERIIGGSVALNHSRPWMIFLFSNPKGCTCGGTLIDPQWVLTAAHCVGNDATYTAVAGTNQRRVVIKGQVISGFGPDAELRNATSVHFYNWNNLTTRQDDIALLKLDSPFTISANIKAIPLASKEYQKGVMLAISGWGRTSPRVAKRSILLMTAYVPVVSNEECQEKFSSLYDGQMCAGFRDGKMGSCSGDSGGPLVDIKGDDVTLVGVLSYGKIHCDSYDVFSSVKFYASWINETMKSY